MSAEIAGERLAQANSANGLAPLHARMVLPPSMLMTCPVM